jgi:hypothetical protein
VLRAWFGWNESSKWYRVNIKFFPCWQTFITRKLRGKKKHIFLQLLKLVSKILCKVFIGMIELHNLLVSKWRQWRRKPSGKDFMLILYFSTKFQLKGPYGIYKSVRIFKKLTARCKFVLVESGWDLEGGSCKNWK